jgi:hypothetical protein
LARLFAITLFASAFLLFWTQPLVAKMLLPYLGGSPSVWNVAMCFFQAALLAGYAWACFLTRRLTLPQQICLHLAVVSLGLVSLPFSVPILQLGVLSEGAEPTRWLLLTMLLMCGLPFFALSATSPLLQRWFATTGHPRANDPYFLFAASNAGSLLVLAAFPVLFEPLLRLEQQGTLWEVGYVLTLALLLLSGVVAAKQVKEPAVGSTASDSTETDPPAVEPITTARRAKWVFLAFLPSSLMLGVTQYLTTDVATVPLLWIVPLAIYLMTFILAFGRKGRAASPWFGRLLPLGLVGALFTVLSRVNDPIAMLFPLHLALLFVAGMVCHGRLAVDRPPVRSLTEFYFWLSLGGVAGGVFNGLAAPALFDRVAEYPLAMVGLALLVPLRAKGTDQGWWRVPGLLAPVILGAVTFGLIQGVRRLPADSVQMANWLAFGVPCVAAYFLVDRPRRFASALAMILVAGWLAGEPGGDTLARERNFFGVSRVARGSSGMFHELHHGSTIHGRQFIEPARRHIPLSYYHRTGPLKQIMDEFERRDTPRRVAVIGLGSGAMAAYAKSDQDWTFYEIDPVVIRFARNTNFFTYLSDSQANSLEIVQGDARLKLHTAPEEHYGLIVLDAFTSDSVPVHLLTREAMQLYLSKLAPGGVLGFHVSNRNLNIRAVIGALAADAQLICVARDEDALGDRELFYGKDPSQWLMVSREAGEIPSLVRPHYWRLLEMTDASVWTDDRSSLWQVLQR